MKVKEKILRCAALLAVIAAVLLSVLPAFASGRTAGAVFASSREAFSQEREHRAELTGKKKKKNKSSSYDNTQKYTESSAGNNASQGNDSKKSTANEKETELTVEEKGTYTSREEVALYIHLFNHLPDNYITKNEAKDLGWVNSKGNLDEVAPGKSIGGDRFGNYEGQLPDKKGRKYFECDIDYKGGYRDSKRIIFSNDGLVYYTEDHYETFEKLY